MISGKKNWVEQQSIYDGFMPDWRKVVPESSFEWTIFSWAYSSLTPEDFSEMFKSISTGKGRNPVAPFKTLLAMIYAIHFNLSDRLLERDTKFNIAAKVACGLDLNESIDAATLCRHRKLFLTMGGKVLQKSLSALKDSGFLTEVDMVIIDSYAVIDSCATMDTYTLLKTAILRLMTELKLTELNIDISDHTYREDYSKKGKADIDWQNDKAKDALLKDYYEDAKHLLTQIDAYVGQVPESVTACATLLASIIAQNIEIDNNDKPFIPQKVAPNRILSTNDTESRHGRKTSAKKIDGYKSHIVTDGEVVLEVTVTPANVPDGDVILALTDAVISHNDSVNMILGDGAYGQTEIINELEAKGITPILKVMEPIGKEGFFNKDQFDIDITDKTCTCPAGVTTNKLYTSKVTKSSDVDNIEPFVEAHLPESFFVQETDYKTIQFFKFSGKVCSQCSMQAQCTTAKTGRTISLHKDEEKLQECRALQNTEEFKELYRLRSRVERVNSEMTRHGGRMGRYVGMVKNLFQQQLVATAHNLACLARSSVTAFINSSTGEPCQILR
jgi:hypothetical protein